MAELKDIRPQRQNANRHRPRGMAALETSVQTDGWIGAITTAADGETFDGSARVEVAAATGFEDAIVIRSDGTKPIIHIREDIPSADDPRAKRLGLAANRVAELNLDIDAEVLASLGEEIDLSQFWTREELETLIASVPGDVWSDALGALPQGDKAPFQQMTFTVSDEQAEQVKRALEAAKRVAPFVDTGNENSNGNALARVCEVFLGQC